MFVYLSGICHSKQPKFPYNSQITIPTDACFPLHLPTFDEDNITDSKGKKIIFARKILMQWPCLSGLVVYQFSQNILFSTTQKNKKEGFFIYVCILYISLNYSPSMQSCSNIFAVTEIILYITL